MRDELIPIIAEVANAHEGKLSRAKTMVDLFADSADIVKFQKFTADELVLPSHPDYEVFSRLEMDEQEWSELISHTRDAGVEVYADVFGRESVRLMIENDIDGFKIHNADVTNTSLLDDVADVGKPVLLSAGGSTELELAEALDQLTNVETTLMYGYQNYPTAPEDANLYRIQALRERFGVPVGYASHAPGGTAVSTELPRLAAAAGGSVLEVHVTRNRSQEGTDHYSSLEPDEFKSMVEAVRETEPLLGRWTLSLSQSEQQYRNNHKKWLVATAEITAGEKFTQDSIGYRRLEDPTRNSLSVEQVVGETAKKELSPGDVITPAHMNTRVVAVLACRNESTRLYGKPLQLVGDRPILEHLVSRLELVDVIDDIVLAIADTPSKEAFISFAQKRDMGYTVGPEEDVLKRLIRAGQTADTDIAVRVTTENPYVYHENINELVTLHRQENCDLTITEKLPLGTTVEVVSFEALQKAHQHGEDRHRSELCTLFIVENSDIFDVRTVSPPENLSRPDIRLTVDNPEDLVVVRDVWENVADGIGEPSLESIIAYLDKKPRLTELQADLPDGTTEDIKSVRPFMYGDGG
jgi:N,N'-diacetyllegionaminate synthase